MELNSGRAFLVKAATFVGMVALVSITPAYSQSNTPSGTKAPAGSKAPAESKAPAGNRTPLGSADPLGLPGPPCTLPWYQYYAAGDAALTAERYWKAALTEAEKMQQFPTGDRFIKVRLSVLEERLTEMYPKDLSKNADEGDKDKIEKQKDQVGVLLRIARINERVIKSNDILRSASVKRYQDAKTALDKAIATNKKKEAESESKSNP